MLYPHYNLPSLFFQSLPPHLPSLPDPFLLHFPSENGRLPRVSSTHDKPSCSKTIHVFSSKAE